MAGRRRRQAAEQRLIEQQRWGQYLEDEDGDFSVVAPTTPVNTRRRARRTSRRNSARDDLEEYLNGTGDDKFGAHEDELDLDVALGNPSYSDKDQRPWNVLAACLLLSLLSIFKYLHARVR